MKRQNIIALTLFTLALVNIALQYLAGEAIGKCAPGIPIFTCPLLNADVLYIPTLFSDLLAKHGHFQDWFLTPAPYFFPDYPMFLLAYLLGSGPYIQILIFALLQVSLTFGAIWLLAKQVLNHAHALLTATAVSILLIWLALTASQPFVLLLVIGFHYGTFLVSIIFMALWLQIKDPKAHQNQRLVYGLLALLAFLAAVSDRLFIAQTIAPLIALTLLIPFIKQNFILKPEWLAPAMALILLGLLVLQLAVSLPYYFSMELGFIVIAVLAALMNQDLLLKLKNHLIHPSATLKAQLPLILIIASTLIGIIVFKLIPRIPHYYYGVIFEFKKIVVNLGRFYAAFQSTVSDHPLFSGLFLLYLGVVLRLFYHLRANPCVLDHKRSWLILFSFLSMTLVLLAFLLIAIPDTIRYLIPFFFWPLIIAFFYLSRYLTTRFIPTAMMACLLPVLALSVNSYQLIQKNGLNTRYYTSEIACVDETLKKAQLNHGLAPYWAAKYFQTFSHLENLVLAQYNHDIVNDYNWYWITSKRYVRENYDFAIMDEPASPEPITRINGSPQLVKSCGFRKLYLYGKDRLQVNNTFNPGDSYLWKACDLPTEIGQKSDQCAMEKKDKTQAGFVTHGPYKKLPAGQYHFEITYISPADTSVTVGAWGVVVDPSKNLKVLTSQPLLGTHWATGKASGDFFLDSTQDLKEVEIRTWAKKNQELKVLSLQITRDTRFWHQNSIWE